MPMRSSLFQTRSEQLEADMETIKFETEITGPDAASVYEAYHALIAHAIDISNSHENIEALVYEPHCGPKDPDVTAKD